MIVELCKTGRKGLDLKRGYGFSEVTMYKWIKKISPLASIDETEITLEEIKFIKQEMFHLQEENKILKKLRQLSLAVKDRFPLAITR